MNNVLFIAYYFPPIGGAGVQRSAKFVKYLPDFGWRPVVVTVRSEDYHVHREFQEDPSLLADVQEGRCEVHRVRDPEPKRIRSWLERVKVFRICWWLLYPLFWEKQFFWSLKAARAAVRLARERGAAVVYTSAAPYSSLIAGWLVKRKTGLPWVADLRDLWTQDSMYTWPSRWHYRLTVALERFLLRRADVVIANTPRAAERLKALVGSNSAAKVMPLPNGYDVEDVPRVSTECAPGRPFTLIHVGTFHDATPALGRKVQGIVARLRTWWRDLSYRPCPLDPALRTPKSLLEAVARLVERDPEFRRRLRLVFVGHLDPQWMELARRLGIADMLEVPGYLPHDQALRQMAESDALFCVQIGFADLAKVVPYVPAKLYEYLAVGKPILAPVAEGDTKDVLRQSGVAHLPDAKDPEDIARALAEMYARWKKGVAMQPNMEFIRSFERKALTARLAEVLDGLVKQGVHR